MAGAADGTTGFSGHVDHPRDRAAALSAPYDPLRDFAAVSLLTQSPILLACHPGLGVRTVGDLIARARKSPALNYGTSAIGGGPHLATELFQSPDRHQACVTCATTKPESSTAISKPVQSDLSFNNIASMLPRCRRGALTALGMSSSARSAAAPDIQLCRVRRSGYEMSHWTGIVAPAATPPESLQS